MPRPSGPGASTSRKSSPYARGYFGFIHTVSPDKAAHLLTSTLGSAAGPRANDVAYKQVGPGSPANRGQPILHRVSIQAKVESTGSARDSMLIPPWSSSVSRPS